MSSLRLRRRMWARLCLAVHEEVEHGLRPELYENFDGAAEPRLTAGGEAASGRSRIREIGNRGNVRHIYGFKSFPTLMHILDLAANSPSDV